MDWHLRRRASLKRLCLSVHHTVDHDRDLHLCDRRPHPRKRHPYLTAPSSTARTLPTQSHPHLLISTRSQPLTTPIPPPQTITATLTSTVTTITTTTTTTITGPRPTVSTCYDYQSSPLNAAYSYLSPADVASFSVQTTYVSDLIHCCNSCYITPNCITYTLVNVGFALQCNKYLLPGNGALGNPNPVPPVVGYNAQCPLGIFKGTRQLTSGGKQLAIGPCLDADYVN